MWRLTDPTEEQLQDYCGWLRQPLTDRLKRVSTKKFQKIVIPHIDELLTKKPIELLALNNKLMLQLIPTYAESELAEFLKIKARTNETLRKEGNIEGVALKKKYKCLTKMQEWMGYGALIVREKDVSYGIVKQKGRNTCTYCNRMYIPTVETITKDNEIERVTRPHLDHWFTKELYPLMSVSFYNLIPSCPICNSSVKGNEVFKIGKQLHPYLDESRTFRFRADALGGKWGLTIERKEGDIEDRTIKSFRLDEMYDFHADKEVTDIMDFSIENHKDYVAVLYKKVLHDLATEKTPSEIYRMLFGVEFEEELHLDRPLSKLKHDLLVQIGVLKE